MIYISKNVDDKLDEYASFLRYNSSYTIDEELTEGVTYLYAKKRVFPLILLLTVEEHTSIVVTHYVCI